MRSQVWRALATSEPDRAEPHGVFRPGGDEGQSGPYQGLGWNAPFPGTIWGVPTAPSAALSNSQALVRDVAQCPILDRSEAQMSFGYVGNQFQENVVTALVELRAQLAVYDARAVQIVTIPADSPG